MLEATPDAIDLGTQDVLLVAAEKDKIADYTGAVAQAGCVPVVVDVDGFALQNAYELNYRIQPDGVVALMNAGASAININVISSGRSALNRAGSEDTGSTVQIWATPVGTNAASAIGRTVEIRLVPSGTVIPPFDVVVGFTFSPDNPAVLDQIRFTTQCADANDPNCVRDPDSVVTSYNWLFGDGDTASGPEVTHLYGRAGTYVATLYGWR